MSTLLSIIDLLFTVGVIAALYLGRHAINRLGLLQKRHDTAVTQLSKLAENSIKIQGLLHEEIKALQNQIDKSKSKKKNRSSNKASVGENERGTTSS